MAFLRCIPERADSVCRRTVWHRILRSNCLEDLDNERPATAIFALVLAAFNSTLRSKIIRQIDMSNLKAG